MRIAGLAVLAESQLARGDIAAAAEAVDGSDVWLVRPTARARTRTEGTAAHLSLVSSDPSEPSSTPRRRWTSWRACTGSVGGGEAHLWLRDSPCHHPPMSSMPRPAPRSRLSKP
jgi:hypothetical protein